MEWLPPKIFYIARLCLSYLLLQLQIAGFSWDFFVYIHWHLWVDGFFSSKTETCGATRKSKELTTRSFLGSHGLQLLCLLPTFQGLLMFLLYVASTVSMVFSGENREMNIYSIDPEPEVRPPSSSSFKEQFCWIYNS